MKNVDEANFKAYKNNYKHIDIHNIGYITTKKIDDYGNIHSVNPLYLIIHSATGHFEKDDENKHLIFDSAKKMCRILVWN